MFMDVVDMLLGSPGRVVPAVFTYIDDLQKALARLFGKRRSES